MTNMSGKFLSQWHMAEAKHSEAIVNAIQKRAGTRHPLSETIAWSCGCCIQPYLKRDKTIATPEEADAILRTRKNGG
jgi:hypothetical protein